MPCYDGREHEDNTRNWQLASVLCGIITKNGLGILDNLDWKEIGVKKTIVLSWWEQHLIEDKRRRDREKYDQTQKQLQKNAMKKLTAEELNALLKKR